MQKEYVTETASLDRSRERYSSAAQASTASDNNAEGFERGRKTMDSMPVKGPRVSAAKRKQRLFAVCFVTASAIAMLGWLTGIGWAALSLLRMLL
jgi:hypothetical protein